MVFEYDLPSFSQWLPGALANWLFVVGALGLLTLLLSWLVMTVRYGPTTAAESLGRTFLDLLPDLLVSPRRVFALAWLAVRESIRSRVVAVVAVFLLILLFAGWFLDPQSMDPGRLYISSVLWMTSVLVLLLMLFLSTLSLPADFKNRTIYTIVTKPVRPTEIVLGRILGFGLIGTVLLLLMCAVSYVFVVRGLSHTHAVNLAELTAEESGPGGPRSWSGKTAPAQGHRHEVHVDDAGRVKLETAHGHAHRLNVKGQVDAAQGSSLAGTVETGDQEGLLLARVPRYGKLQFRDRAGHPTDKGINTGDEWTYRGYVEGGSLSSAVWTFEGLRADDFPSGYLPVEMNIAVFRTHKGDLEKGIPGSLTVINPSSGLKAEVKLFRAKKGVIDPQYISRKIRLSTGEEKDLFSDFVSDGRLEIMLRSLQPAQYFGVAQRDLYLRAGDADFRLNFLKGFYGVWQQMVLVIVFGVMFSTFLSGPIAMLATLGTLAAGMAVPFMRELATNKILGGGPAEAFIRLLRQDNMITDLEPGFRTTVAKGFDWFAAQVMGGVSTMLPEFNRFSYSRFVTDGFNVDPDLLAEQSLTVLAFAVTVYLAGYLFLKAREVAR